MTADGQRSITTSADGQWAAVRRGRDVSLYAAGAPPAVGQLTLDGDDVDLALVGPPVVLVAATRVGNATAITLHQLPHLEVGARLEVEMAIWIAATTGPRLVLVSADKKRVTILRAAGRALATQSIDVGGPIEFAVGLERNQALFGLQRKLETWDMVSGRPMLRLQLQLPPPPRTIGTAAGHLWATRPGSDEVFVYRLSDGRPFKHLVGSPVDGTLSHPSSPLLVLATRQGLVRVHCFAHTVGLVDGVPWTPGQTIPLAQLVVGDDIALLGLPDGASEPWRIPIAGTGVHVQASSEATTQPIVAPKPAPLTPDRAAPRSAAQRPAGSGWRDVLATFGGELARGGEAAIPIVAGDTELGELAQRLGISDLARRALIVLYAMYLVGEAPSIAALVRSLGDWTEALGRGDLGALAMLRRKAGTVALRTGVTDVLDGAAPRRIRLVGTTATTPRAGIYRVSRDGRGDATIESELAAELGLIGVVEGKLSAALLEARLHGAVAVTAAVPDARPKPWPRDAGLVLVLPGNPTAWVADIPTLTPKAE